MSTASTERVKQMVEEGLERVREPQQNVGENERWASLAGGVALALSGLRRGGAGGITLGALGGLLLYRGLTGHCAMYERIGRNTAAGRSRLLPAREIQLSTSITIDRSPDELYTFWRNFENLSRFMHYIVDVRTFDDRRSHWVARAPFGQTVAWDSEVTEDVPNERIRWRSTVDSDVRHHGEVRFRPGPGGRGTEVDVDMRYEPPGGTLGATFARFFNGITRHEMQADIRRFKQLMETGDTTTAADAAEGAAGDTRH